MVLLLISFLLVQPDGFKTWLLNSVARHVPTSSPYTVSVGRVTGNFFTTFFVENARVISKAEGSELGQFKLIHITWRWKAPFHLQQAGFEWIQPDQGHATAHFANGRGKGQAEKIVWEGKRLGKINFTFALNPEHQELDATAVNVQWQHPVKKPFDIETAHVMLSGSSPTWTTAASFRFRNGSTAQMDGSLTRGVDLWDLTWRRLSLAFPSGGAWVAKRAGSVVWRKDRVVEIHHLMLGNGTQTLEIPEAILAGKESQLSFFARRIDLGPWAKLFWPELVVNGGVLNASLHMNSASKHARIEGFLSGKIQSVQYESLGLTIQDIDIDLQGVDRHLRVRRFTGKTKKGDIQIVGSSLWPALDYTLRARELMIHKPPSVKGTADLDLHLGGTATSPKITGLLTLKEGVYTYAKEKEKDQKPPAKTLLPPALSLDVRVQWPRNVWYRDGVTGIETQGDLRIQKPISQTHLLLTGTVSSIRGTYNYFGRDFMIETGQIEFTGTPELNPLLNAVASYRGEATLVYLDITGSLKQPELKLRSNPPLPEQDIISVIVFGRPLSQLRSRTGNQTTNQQMMQAVGGVLGSYVTKSLRQTGISQLQVDVFNLQPSPQGGQLTVGRYVGRRLFVSYGQTLRGSAEKSITADYFLTDKWTLQGASNSTQGNTMDFLFRYPLKKGSGAKMPPLPNSPFRNSLDQPAFVR